MKGSDVIERRRHPRVVVNEQARLLSPSYAVLSCTIRDLSAGGTSPAFGACDVRAHVHGSPCSHSRGALRHSATSPYGVNYGNASVAWPYPFGRHLTVSSHLGSGHDFVDLEPNARDPPEKAPLLIR